MVRRADFHRILPGERPESELGRGQPWRRDPGGLFLGALYPDAQRSQRATRWILHILCSGGRQFPLHGGCHGDHGSHRRVSLPDRSTLPVSRCWTGRTSSNLSIRELTAGASLFLTWYPPNGQSPALAPPTGAVVPTPMPGTPPGGYSRAAARADRHSGARDGQSADSPAAHDRLNENRVDALGNRSGFDRDQRRAQLVHGEL